MKRVLGPILVLASAAGFTACLICLYEGMRHVMRTSGGYCASGGPYVVAHQCSSGDVRLIMIGVFGMLLAGGVLASVTGWMEGSVLGVGLLMWAALFGALGWNFMYFGLNPPAATGGSGGWIACGVVFWLMALGGLIPVIGMVFGWLRRGGEPETPSISTEPLVRAAVPITGPTEWRTP